jgi:hypothetical protein
MMIFILFTLILYWIGGAIYIISGFKNDSDLKIILGFLNMLTGTISIFSIIKIMIDHGIH